MEVHHRISVFATKTHIVLKPITSASAKFGIRAASSLFRGSKSAPDEEPPVVVIDRETGTVSEQAKYDLPKGTSPAYRHPVLGVVGVIQLFSGPHIIFITEAKSVFKDQNERPLSPTSPKSASFALSPGSSGSAQSSPASHPGSPTSPGSTPSPFLINDHDEIFVIKRVSFLAYSIDQTKMSSEQIRRETEYVGILTKLLTSGSFYYSYTADITNTAQRAHAIAKLPQDPEMLAAAEAAVAAQTSEDDVAEQQPRSRSGSFKKRPGSLRSANSAGSDKNLLGRALARMGSIRLKSLPQEFLDAVALAGTGDAARPTNRPSDGRSRARSFSTMDAMKKRRAPPKRASSSSALNSRKGSSSRAPPPMAPIPPVPPVPEAEDGPPPPVPPTPTSPSASSSASVSSPPAASLTYSLPQTDVPLWKRADVRFFWNQFLATTFIEAALDAWVLPIMCGFVSSRRQVAKSGGPRFTFILISRRSVYHAGARYKTRGIDADGHVANNVETEQVLIAPDGALHSFVQTRGSVPLFWNQRGFKYKPHPRLTENDKKQKATFRKHFESQFETYGTNLAVDLLNQTGVETILGSNYADHVARWGHEQLSYLPFDFHDVCKGNRFDKVSVLVDEIRDSLTAHGWYFRPPNVDALTPASQAREQTGVIRTNCLDCLDRTNVVQSAVAREILERQLMDAGLLAFESSLSDVPTFEATFKHVWADNGNAMSNQYAGTDALKGDFTRTGKRNIRGMVNDSVNSVTRYYKNNFRDGSRQAAFDLLLGRRVIDPSADAADIVEQYEAEVYNWDEEQEAAVELCRDRILAQHPKEKFLGGWVVISINKWDAEQERILVVTDSGYYRCKYDFTGEAMSHFTRVPLGNIAQVQHGQFRHGGIVTGGVSKMYGFRIFTQAPEKSKHQSAVSSTMKKSPNYRTYMAASPKPEASGLLGQSVALDVVKILNKAVVDRFGAHSDGEPFVKEGYVSRNSGVISAAFNKLGLGLFDRRKVVESRTHSTARDPSKSAKSGAGAKLVPPVGGPRPSMDSSSAGPSPKPSPMGHRRHGSSVSSRDEVEFSDDEDVSPDDEQRLVRRGSSFLAPLVAAASAAQKDNPFYVAGDENRVGDGADDDDDDETGDSMSPRGSISSKS